MSSDLAGPLPMSSKQYQYIVIFQDACTKYIIAHPIKRATAEQMIEVLRSEVLLKFVAPRILYDDNGSQYRSQEWQNFCQEHNTGCPKNPGQ